jgi:hypothetical protein
MTCLTSLGLGANQISDNGVTALAKAITPVSQGGSGALPALEILVVEDNPAM